MPNKLATANLEITSPQSTPHLGYHYQLYYCRVCPKGSLTAALPSAVGGEQPFWSALLASPLRFGLLPVFLVLMILVSRGFCQTFCPLGAIYGLCCRLSLLRIKVNAETCTRCGLCNRVCPVDLDVAKEAGGRECIACGDCIRACPKGAIRRQVGF
jgi:ferredoxin-type protein NapH